MFSVKELQSLIDTIKQIVKQQTDDVFNKSESNTYGTIVADNGDNTYNVSVAGIDSILSNVINKSLLSLDVGDNVVVKFNIGNLSNGYIALKLGNNKSVIKGGDYKVGELYLVDYIYPIGSIITNANSSFNPNTLYLNTTWVQNSSTTWQRQS